VTWKNAILSITDLDRTPIVPNCRRLLNYPKQQTLGAFLAPAGPLALQIDEYPLFWPFTPLKLYCRMLKIKIILPTPQTIAYCCPIIPDQCQPLVKVQTIALLSSRDIWCTSCCYLPPRAIYGNLWPRWGQFNLKLLCIASPMLVHPFPKVVAMNFLSKQYHTIIFIIVHPPKIIKRENGPVRPINISWEHQKHPLTPAHLCLQTFGCFQSRRTMARRPHVQWMHGRIVCFYCRILEARRPRSDWHSNTQPTPIDPPTLQLQSIHHASPDSTVSILLAYLFERRQIRPPKINTSDIVLLLTCPLLWGYTQPPMMMEEGVTCSKASCNDENDLSLTIYVYVHMYHLKKCNLE
jgi:hypothetical protein